MTTLYYKVADFRFSVQVPAGLDIQTLLPTFRAFRCCEQAGDLLFHLDASYASLPEDESAVLWEESVNDMGYTRLMKTDNGYCVTLRYTECGREHTMLADSRFTSLRAAIDWTDPYAGAVLCSMLRIAYAQAVVYHRAVSIHASVVCLQDKGYLFMGKSGTGKSTHASLWREAFEGCELLNDDNPTIRLTDEGCMVYGTPWSGKTPCYKDKRCLLAGMARLKQAWENRFFLQEDIGAFAAVLPGCSVIRKDAAHYDALCATLVELVGRVRTGLMQCLPNKDAASVCRAGLEENVETSYHAVSSQ